MASRFEQNKPDPRIKSNVRRARASARGTGAARAFVAAASLATTLGAWGLFAAQDAQSLAQQSQAAVTPVAAVAAVAVSQVQAQAQAIATATPAAIATTAAVAQVQAVATAQPSATPQATATPQAAAAAWPAAVTTTRSSR